MTEQTNMYLLILSDLSTNIRVDHSFGDGPVKAKRQTEL